MAENAARLDEYDRRLLYELDRDSSLPLSALAKKVGRSKQFVLFRQKKLEDAGVITGYTAIVDMARLGYMSFRIYLKFRQTTMKEAMRIVEFIKKLPNVWTITLLHGKWDLAVFIGTKNANEVHAAWDPLMERYKERIAGYNFALYAPIYNSNRTFFLDREMPIVTREYGAGVPEEIDGTDQAIIRAYAPHARQSVLQVARRLKLAPETVRRRIASLRKRNVIIGYKIGLDIGKLGYTSYQLDFELASRKRWDELFEYCRRHPKIYQVQRTVGHMDLETEVVVKDLPELISIIEEFKSRFPGTINNVEYFGYSTYHLLNYIPD
ncbi:MAG: Lrp/AsnC family transcriptional regulator [Candidatus Micrarchaeia archaeon]|jgi:Lrp/AsnC family leucine-responsive transcriptional regulator